MSDHATLPPSSAHIWGASGGCAGWAKLSKKYPERGDQTAADEGTASHEFGEYLITSALECLRNERPDLIKTLAEDKVGTPASNGVIFTDDMIDGAELYATDVLNGVLNEGAPPEHVHVEERLGMSWVHPEVWGTPDAVEYSTDGKTVTIWDYKFGRTVVEVFENLQLITYAAGTLQHAPNAETFRFKVVQPRAAHRDGPVREWVVARQDLEPFWAALQLGALRSMSDDAEVRSGAHCKHCTARHACEAARLSAATVCDVVANAAPANLSPSGLAYELDFLLAAKKLLDARLSGIEAEATQRLKTGAHVPEYTLEHATGRTAWNIPAEQVAAMGDLCGLDLRKPVAVKTPKQSLKLGFDNALYTAYTTTPSGAAKLVKLDPRRVAAIFNKPITGA